MFCVRFIDDELNPHEEFVGLHNMETTTALSITKTIEDIMCRLSLTIKNCRGQCYDGASAMAGCKTRGSNKAT